MKNLNLDDVYKKAKIFGVIIISISFAYYLIIFLPEKENYKREVEKEKSIGQEISKQKEDNQKKITACLGNAEKIKSEIKQDNEKYVLTLGVKIFEDIFYNSELGSCIYITRNIVPGEGGSLSRFVVKDFATDRIIESAEINQDNYDKLIAKYKNIN